MRPSRRTAMSRHHRNGRAGAGRTSLYDDITNKVIAEIGWPAIVEAQIRLRGEAVIAGFDWR